MIIKGIFAVFILSGFLFIGCKEDAVTQDPGPNNNQTAEIPQLTEPVNNSSVQSSTPELKWNSFPDAVTYRVQVSLDANFHGTMISDSVVSGTQMRIAASLITGVNFYWRIAANLNGGTVSNWSAVWRFYIILPPPPVPILLLPANNSNNQSFLPLFDWDDSPTADKYRIQISPTSSFTTALFDSSLTVSQWQCKPMLLNTNTVYYWRVSASNSNGQSVSDWSAVFNFTTIQGPQPNSISGTITFVDNFFVGPPYYYVAGAYTLNSWPPSEFTHPYRFDSLIIQQSGNVYTANYKITGLPDGAYYIASSFRMRTLVQGSILGTYGCDTSRIQYSTCAITPIQVNISGNNGIEGINFLSWSDSTKSIF